VTCYDSESASTFHVLGLEVRDTLVSAREIFPKAGSELFLEVRFVAHLIGLLSSGTGLT